MLIAGRNAREFKLAAIPGRSFRDAGFNQHARLKIFRVDCDAACSISRAGSLADVCIASLKQQAQVAHAGDILRPTFGLQVPAAAASKSRGWIPPTKKA